MALLANWCEAGLEPDSFWHQSPATFEAIMRGVVKRMERESDLAISQAYHMAAFNAGTKSKGGLKPLAHYLRRNKPQTPTAMVEMLRTMGAKSNMKISRVKLDSPANEI